MLRVAVSGYYGFNNTGDEAILAALITTLRALAPGVDITVFSHCPRETRRLFGVRAVNRWNPLGVAFSLLRSDLLLSGGGGLLQDVTGVRSLCYYLAVVALAKILGKPVIYYAQGVGPIRTRFGRWLTRIISNRVDLITVRDQASRDDFLQMGVDRPPVVVTADPVLAVSPAHFGPEAGAAVLDRARGEAGEEAEGGEPPRGVRPPGKAAAPGVGAEKASLRETPEKPSLEREAAAGAGPGQTGSGETPAGGGEGVAGGEGCLPSGGNPSGGGAAAVGQDGRRPDPGREPSGNGSGGAAEGKAAAGAGQAAGKARPAGEKKRRLLGIAVRDWKDCYEYKRAIAAAADRLVREGWEVVFIPFHFPRDLQSCQETSWLMQEPNLLIRFKLSVEELFSLLGQLDLVLGMRLHALIMASVMRTPCVGITYDPKVARFLEMTGQPVAGTVEDLDGERLYEEIVRAWERRQEIAAHLEQVLVPLRQRAWETAALAMSVFYSRYPHRRGENGRDGRSPGAAERQTKSGRHR